MHAFYSPDPTFTTKNILNTLKDVVDWKSLGIQLDISSSKLNEIDHDNRGQVAGCKRDLVQFWLDSDGSCSWIKLSDALIAIPNGCHSVLAEEIKTTKCSGMDILCNQYMCKCLFLLNEMTQRILS